MLITVKQYQKKIIYIRRYVPKPVRHFFIVLGSWCMFEQRFQTLVPRVSSGFPNTRKLIKALGLRPRGFISFLVFGNPDETLALVFEILHHWSLNRSKGAIKDSGQVDAEEDRRTTSTLIWQHHPTL